MTLFQRAWSVNVEHRLVEDTHLSRMTHICTYIKIFERLSKYSENFGEADAL